MEAFNAFDEEILEMFHDKIDAIQQKVATVMATTVIQHDCPHTATFDSSGTTLCGDCGANIILLDFEPEWRFYGTGDNRSAKDPSRCHGSKESTKGGIDKVFQDAKQGHLPLNIRHSTELKYKTIVGDATVRGSGRKAIVAACLMYVYREESDYRTSDEIRMMFDLTKKKMSEGLERYYVTFPESRIAQVTPINMLRRIMRLSGVSTDHYPKICRLLKAVNGTDEILNRSSPQSVASAAVYLFLCINPAIREQFNITKQSFSLAVDISHMTICKLAKIAATSLFAGEKIEM